MRRIALLAAVICSLGFASMASAQTIPVYSYPSAGTPPQVQLQCDTSYQNCVPITANNPVPVTVASGGTGVTAQQTQGNAASGTTTAANPVVVAGRYNVSAPTLATGQRGDMQLDPAANLKVVLGIPGTGASVASTAANQDGLAGGINTLAFSGFNLAWNGATWDRMPGSTSGAYVNFAPSAATAVALTPAVASLANGVVGKAAPGNLYSVEVVTGAAAAYLYVFNSTTIPADGAVTAGIASGNYQFCMPVAATTGARFGYDIPERYSVGVSVAVSSTACGTLTKIATAVFVKARVQ